MPSRAFHHKGRHGCTNCKERRKRCDQIKPTCGRCARRGNSCTYSKDSSTTTLSQSSNPLILPRTPSEPWNALNPLFQAVMSAQVRHVEMDDLEMIHHGFCGIQNDSWVFPAITNQYCREGSELSLSSPWNTCSFGSSLEIYHSGYTRVETLILCRKGRDSPTDGDLVIYSNIKFHQLQNLSLYFCFLRNTGRSRIWFYVLARTEWTS